MSASLTQMPWPATTGTSSRPTSAARSTLVRPQRSRAIDDLLADLGQVGVDGPAVLAGRPGRGGQQLVGLAEHGPDAEPEADQPAAGAAAGQGLVLGHEVAAPGGGRARPRPRARRPPPRAGPAPPARPPPPGWPGEPRLVWQNMSLTQVAPDSSSSAPLSMAPTRAISLVRWRPTGATSRSPHSNRVRSSPMPQISASDRWVWPLTSPGSTTPWSSPTTSAPGNRSATSAKGPTARTSPPAKATAPPARSPAGPMVRTWPPRTTVVGLMAAGGPGGTRGARG